MKKTTDTSALIGPPEDAFTLRRSLTRGEKDDLLCIYLGRAQGLVDVLMVAYGSPEPPEWHWETTSKIAWTIDGLLKQAQAIVNNRA